MTLKSCLCLPLLALLWLVPSSNAGATSYTLTVIAQGSGTISTNPVFATYPANATVSLTATPSIGWYFAGWSGAASGTTNQVNVFISGNLTVTGLFLAFPIYPVTLATNGSGAIDLSPSGGSYTSNTVVTATATPAAGWVFTGWSGAASGNANPLSLTVDASESLTANFAELPAFTMSPQGVTNVVGSTVSFSTTAVGTAPLAYQWYFNTAPLAGDTSPTLTLTATTAGEAGFYEVVVTNNFGSVTSAPVALVLTNGSQSTNFVSVCNEAALQSAISAGGWISIGCNGTITLTNTLSITNRVILDGSHVAAMLSGNNSVRLFYVAQGASLAITNLTLANGECLVTSGAGPADGGAIYNNGGTVTLTGCTLTNNSAIADIIGGAGCGGAVFNNGGTVQIYGSEFLNNMVFGAYGHFQYSPGGAGFGGALFNTNGTVIIVNSLFEGNFCTNSGGPGNVVCLGGALYQASGVLLATNSILTDNQALGGESPDEPTGEIGPTPAYGGAVAATGGSVTLDLCALTGNAAIGGSAGQDTGAAPAFGGAVYCSNVLTAVGCSFSGNQAQGGNYAYNGAGYSAATASGGAICNAGTLVLDACLVCSNNTLGGAPVTYAGSEANGGSSFGGGIFNAGKLAVTNSTVALNTAFGAQGVFGNYYRGNIYNGAAIGGGVYNVAGASFEGVNVTIASNLCSALARTDLNNAFDTYVDGFTAGFQIANTNGTLQLLNSLLAYGGTNGNAYGTITDLGDNISSDGSANFNSGTSFNFTDPLLGPLANNGGPTLTMALLPDSPAIAYANSNDGAPPDDQRGYARPTGSGVIDLGAYQFGANQIYIPPPTISLNITAVSTNVVVSFTTLPAITNTIHFQTSTNLTVWTDLATYGAFASPSNIVQTVSQQGASRRFFRLVW